MRNAWFLPLGTAINRVPLISFQIKVVQTFPIKGVPCTRYVALSSALILRLGGLGF